MIQKKMTNKYRRELFHHLNGIVSIPTIQSLLKIISTINSKDEIILDNVPTNINKGYLNVALRLLYSLKFLDYDENKTKRIYKKTMQLNELTDNPDLMSSLNTLINFHIDFNNLGRDDYKKYSQIILTILNKLSRLDISDQSRTYILGLIAGPIIANLGFKNNITIDNQILSFEKKNQSFNNTLIELFTLLGFIVSKGNTRCLLTEKGEFFLSRSAAYGVTVSYLPLLNNLDELFVGNGEFIYQRINNHEIHIDRSMNVWGSGGAHKTYFKKIDTIIKKIFNKDINKQPIGIIDVGCGDGTFLAHLHHIITTKTNRKHFLKTHPLIMIGTDINQKARIASRNKLKNIKHIVIDGNIGNPKRINTILKNDYSHNLSDFLNTRTFLDHNRIYEETESIPNSIETSGAFAHKGRLINKEALTSNLITHFKKWRPFIKKHGLILLELHTLNTKLIRKNIGKTLSPAYDATHGYSDQYLIEHNAFLDCITMAGLNYSKKDLLLFPNNKIPTVSINYIK